LPHLLEPVAVTLDEAILTLDRLINDLQNRQREDIEQPKILVLIDNLDSLLADGQRSVTNRLLRLLQFGAEVGIHLVLALEEPVGEYIEQIMKCDFSQRLIGRVENEKLARAAAKISDTGAELLPGLGAFVGISGGRTFQIQTAYISDYDLYLAVEKLSRQIMRRMVARTAEFRVGFAQAGS
jgi:DNA segregation ATPase FtsK/SpoIIIE-like protein